jgi:hypothetical protein
MPLLSLLIDARKANPFGGERPEVQAMRGQTSRDEIPLLFAAARVMWSVHADRHA